MNRFIKTSIQLFLSLALFPALALAQLPDPGIDHRPGPDSPGHHRPTK